MKEKRKDCDEEIERNLKVLNKNEINLATVNQAAVEVRPVCLTIACDPVCSMCINDMLPQRLFIRQALFKGLGQVKFPEPDAEELRRASMVLHERAQAAAGGKPKKALWKPSKETVGESGGGRDDAIRRQRLDALWRIGMEVTREEVHKALIKQGLTRDDTNGIDKEIYSGIRVRLDLSVFASCLDCCLRLVV